MYQITTDRITIEASLNRDTNELAGYCVYDDDNPSVNGYGETVQLAFEDFLRSVEREIGYQIESHKP